MSDVSLARDEWLAVDIEAALAEPAAPIDYVLPGLAAGTVGGLVAAGGTGKSMLALQIAVQIATGVDKLGLAPLTDSRIPREWPEGRVAYLAAEDPVFLLKHRLYAIGQTLTADERRRTKENFSLTALAGTACNIMMKRDFERVLRTADGARLLVVDTLRRIHREDENVSSAMAEVVGRMERIAYETGCAVLFLHHANKTASASRSDVQEASRGSSAVTDTCRWQANLRPMTEKEGRGKRIPEGDWHRYVRLTVPKVNYAARIEPYWLVQGENGLLKPAEAKRRQTARGDWRGHL